MNVWDDALDLIETDIRLGSTNNIGANRQIHRTNFFVKEYSVALLQKALARSSKVALY